MIEPMTMKQLAELAGYSYRQLYNIDRDLPEKEKLFKKVSGTKCDPAFFVQNWVRFNLNRERGEELSLEEQKAVHERVKTRKTELEVLRMEGTMVDVQEVKMLWGEIANTVMQSMMHVAGKLAPQLLMMDDVGKIAAVIDEEVRRALTALADTPIPDGAEAEETGAEADEQECAE